MVQLKQGIRALSLTVGVLALSLPAACGRTPLRTGEVVPDAEQPLAPPRDTQRVVLDAVDKVDLLFVIDNSISMADKQELLRDAVPTLLERLINPPCISVTDRNRAVEVAGPSAACPPGYRKEFEPLIDLHVGVITSSLGGHGGDLCGPGLPSAFNPTKNDHAHLLASVRAGLPAYGDEGFLAWDPAGNKSPPGDHDVGRFIQSFQDHVTAAGEQGCGYEATQEAWYRFLVEPDPYAEVVVNDADQAVPLGTDETLLEQRKAFLRPDSLLMIVVLSDEDDCSVVDGGLGWLTSAISLPSGGSFSFPPATSACADDPNSPCCRSCGIQDEGLPAGCLPSKDDPACRVLSRADASNLRCHRQKQRFGIDLLYPVERYSDALQNLAVVDTRRCQEAAPTDASEPVPCPAALNPLFSGKRDPSLVIYTAIVGVPWQDIATSDSLTGAGLEYLNARELTDLDRWRLVLGDPATGEPPLDPLMIATTNPRSGVHPLTGEALAPANSTDPRANSINGHEFANIDESDLQYACTFPLETPRDCLDDETCDCTEEDLLKNRPLCNPPGGGAAQTTQYYAKAYPGPRHLAIAQALGDKASIASICPKVIEPPTSAPAYGYNAAAAHMYDRLAGGLGERCLAEALPHANDGRAECVLWQLRHGDCDCEAAGLEFVDEAAAESVAHTVEFECSFRLAEGCDRACACQLPQLSGAALGSCQTDALVSGIDGWCSIDQSQNVGDPQFVSDCRVGHPRTLRLLGKLEALRDQDLFLTCPD